MPIPPVCLLLMSAAFAAEPATGGPPIEVGLHAGRFFTGPAESIGGAWVIVPRLGYRPVPTLAIEGSVSWFQGETRLAGNLYDGLAPRLEAVWHPMPELVVEPFVGAGPGLLRRKVHRSGVGTDPNADDWGNYKNPDTDFMLSVGPGAMVHLGRIVSVRTDLRFLPTIGGEGFNTRADVFGHWEWTVGLDLYFGNMLRDADGDGLADPDDGCPNDPEDVDDFEDADGCPDEDNDNDSIADTSDRCPLDPEDLDSFEDADGCPDPDNDQDGVADGEDACRDVAGPKETEGCPDRDGDLVVDSRDACPDEPRDPSVAPEQSDGCPAKVVVTAEKVEILERVFFQVNEAVILPESHGLLGEVARVLVAHPEIVRVEVQGHTDDQAADAYNLKLSQARAQAVLEFLVARGVDAGRLVAKGYGETRPLVPGTTEDARAQNRRVEFVILERSEPAAP